jgi:hypothetical protein
VGVAAAGIGHGREQVLVEVLPEADRGRADSPLGLGLGHGHQGGWIRDADVGKPIGQQQDLLGGVVVAAPELLGPL